MNREVRMVPADWRHPVDDNGEFIPLPTIHYQKVYDAEKELWDSGVFPPYASESSRKMTYEGWCGLRPERTMPEWDDADHFMMYETVTEGTPISPAMCSPETLAQWLTDNNVSWFANQTASYEDWLRVILGAS